MQTYYGPGDDSRRHAATRDAQIEAATLVDPDDVATLPWFGNYASDAGLFDRVHKFIFARIQAGDAAGAQKAARLCSLHGMGIEESQVPDAEFVETFLANYGEHEC